MLLVATDRVVQRAEPLTIVDVITEGDTLYLTEAPEASLRITPGNKGFEDMMAIARRGMQKYRNALRELAK